ncbi:MAG: DUF4012 domain-containing protein [Candidatus Portnoybacteria bacterium]|nr:DUF4012 domain-containing protein [Candidatus Portnoybacteria bacterium]
MQKSKSHILTALFDVRPVTDQGNLDIERIKKIETILDLKEGRTKQENKQRDEAIEIKKIAEDLAGQLLTEELPTREEILAELDEIEAADNLLGKSQISLVKESVATVPLEDFYFPEVASQDYSPAIQFPKQPTIKKSFFSFLMIGFLISLIIPMTAWLSQGLVIKEDVVSSSLAAYQNLLAAQESLGQADWPQAVQNFSSARFDFLQAEEEIQKLGQLTLGILEQLPGGDLISSGSHLVKVGENLAQAGQNLASAINSFSLNNLFSLISHKEGSLTDLMAVNQDNLIQALVRIRLAQEELTQVKVESLPANIQAAVISLEEKLPLVEEILSQAKDYSTALLSILGQDNPRQYLLIFQNNSELRATGGFIGTYGLLTFFQGAIKDLFIEGIYNIDGQLREKIIPPQPIQKISTTWSMHDANWFADFPTSAEKVAWFYEKTGGPTVDGVISLTPTVIERLMKLTGPLAMPAYDLTLTAENFVELIQYQVEIDYDKELNQPKRILADLAPKFIEALNQLSSSKRKEALSIIFDCLKEKHILIYFKEPSLENLVSQEGWSGELLTTAQDYLSVVSSNINGYKTDRVVKETINHQAEIQEDGSIIDTLTITREHQGGHFQYDWWNRVNANYLRVYLPLGSQLLLAQGQTIEIYQPPIDYQKQGFKTDPLVSFIESKMTIDQKTGTHIFEESGQTVLGNWVYVSPGETVTLTYQYKLPFKINLTKSTDSYSLLVQKQAGSLGSQFSHQLKFPANWQVSWQYPDGMNYESGIMNYAGDLKIDRFLGVTFEF